MMQEVKFIQSFMSKSVFFLIGYIEVDKNEKNSMFPACDYDLYT